MWQNSIIFYLLVSVFGFAAVSQLRGEDVASSQRLLCTKSFKLITRIRKTYLDTDKKLVSTGQVVEELYSNEQKRTRISIRSDLGAENHKVYYYETANRGLFVEHDIQLAAKVKCNYTTANNYLDSLLGFKLPADANGTESPTRGLDWLNNMEAPDHIVGFARIAFWADTMRQRFVLEEQPAPSDNQKIRNFQVSFYKMLKGFKDAPLRSDEVEVYYPMTSDQRDWFDLPVRVSIKLKDGDRIDIDFMTAGPIREDLEMMNSRVPLDAFAYPVGISCSNQLAPVAWKTIRGTDLSFHMELIDYGDKQRQAPVSLIKRFVAYDSEANMMRVDSMTYQSYLVAILDPKTNRRFDIFSDSSVLNQDEYSYGSLQSGNRFDRSMGQSQCVESPFYLPNGNSFHPFLPLDRMFPMGRAEVRGVDCMAFEIVTNELPATLFQPLFYTDSKGRYETYFSVDDSDRKEYNLVYYFVANSAATSSKMIAIMGDQTLAALMRVDVYLSGELRYHMDISEFDRKLVDAPNGDVAAELFALRDRCTTGRFGALSHAKVNVELKLEVKDQTAITAKEVKSMLSRSTLRNQVVIKMLSEQYYSLRTNFFDIQTQLSTTDHQDQLRITMEARMLYPDLGISRARVIGYAIVNDIIASSTSAASSAECFAYAASRNPKDSTVFVYCQNRCLVYTGPGLKFSENGKKIVGFNEVLFYSIEDTKITDDHCPLFAVQIQPLTFFDDNNLREVSKNVHEELKRNFKGYLDLPSPESSEVGGVDIPVTITHIDISNDHWSTSVGRTSGLTDLSAVERDSVDAVGLTLKSDRKLVANGTDAEEAPMDYAQCHTVCTSRLECRSFSVCLTNRGVECIISEVDFRDAALLEQIESKRAELGSRLERKTVQVASSGGEQLELRFDPLCKLHKKNTLEMFHKGWSTHLKLQNAVLLSVDSLEKCAEFCWQNNLQFFNKMDKVAQELDVAGIDSKEAAERLKLEHEKNRVDWCSQFHYLNLAYSSDLDWVKRLIKEKDLDKAGLCIPQHPFIRGIEGRHPLTYRADRKEMEEAPKPMFDEYKFTHLSLYTAQYGKMIEIVVKDSREKRQFQTYGLDVEVCARYCFAQTDFLVHPCTSFDFIERLRLGNITKEFYCVLHTYTPDEMEKNGLVVDVDAASDVKAWHYEPKLHAVSSAMIAKRTLDIAFESEGTSGSGSNEFRVHGFGIVVMLLASIACTAVIVKLKGATVVDWLSSRGRRGSVEPFAATLDALD